MAATPTISENGTTFTPGPWEVIDGNVVATQFKGTTPVVMPDGETRQHQTGLLALVYSPGDLTLNFEANARLIAAAPRLLDALRGLVGLIQLIQAREPDLQTNHRYVEALAALAEAEGVNSSQA